MRAGVAVVLAYWVSASASPTPSLRGSPTENVTTNVSVPSNLGNLTANMSMSGAQLADFNGSALLNYTNHLIIMAGSPTENVTTNVSVPSNLGNLTANMSMSGAQLADFNESAWPPPIIIMAGSPTENGTTNVSVPSNLGNLTANMSMSGAVLDLEDFSQFAAVPEDMQKVFDGALLADFKQLQPNESAWLNYTNHLIIMAGSGGGWWPGGDKLWGSGHGVEEINRGNVQYYNWGMEAARSRCGGPSCALIVNPPGHRTKHVFHIHFVHYANWGAHLKHKMERMTCGKGGWHSGHLPCHGKAKFYSGFPPVFTVAMGGGGMWHASVIAWPSSCGGRGTIVSLHYGCSIEHQIRGDFNPALR